MYLQLVATFGRRLIPALNVAQLHRASESNLQQRYLQPLIILRYQYVLIENAFSQVDHLELHAKLQMGWHHQVHPQSSGREDVLVNLLQIFLDHVHSQLLDQ